MHETDSPQHNPAHSPPAPEPPIQASVVPEADVAGPPMTGRQKAWLAARVVLKRLRFFAILAAVGLFIGYWDTIKNYWDKFTRPQSVASRQLEPGQEFFCPMHPNIVKDGYEPNGDVPKCPICGMPLSIRKKGEKEALPPGITGRVQLTPERINQAGVGTVPVGYRPLNKETNTVGYVTFDESRLSKVTSRVAGYVEKLYVDKTFATVHAGDPLAEIYSPELYSAAQELVLAAGNRATSGLAASAREKLALLGVSRQEIDEILRSGNAPSRLMIRAPKMEQGEASKPGGPTLPFVIDKGIVAGSSVKPGMTLFEVADLSSVWVEAEVYEKDVAFLRQDQKVEAAVEAYPSRTFAGRLALVYPQMDAATRTNRVRFVLDNRDGQLRPGMYATVRTTTPLESIEPYRSLAAKRPQVFQVSTSADKKEPQSEVLSVPERAVIDTGAKQVVYVEREPGVYEGVEVQLGPRVAVQEGSRTTDYYPVLQGLKPGDRVVAAGAFLIDAETRLNPAAAAGYFGASGGPQSDRSEPSSPGTQKPAGQPKPKVQEPSADDLQRVAELPESDRQLALQQKFCPIRNVPLGSMGVPYKITLRGKPVFLCCKGCAGKAKAAPDETLKKLEEGKEGQRLKIE